MDIIPDEEFDNYLYIGESLDDSGTLKVLESLLCFKGGKIYQARNDHYAEARAILENRNIKVLLIDQYLNSGNGIDLMLTMQEFASVATIVVVMSDLSIDIIVALEAGATDAVYAGINPRELAARIHVAGRNGYRNSTGHLQSAHSKAAQEHNKSRLPVYYIESRHWLYFTDSSRVILHGREGDLLKLLIASHPECIHRDKISKAIFHREWNPSDRSIDNLISRLRKIIDPPESGHTSSVIETVRNGGYRLRYSISLLADDQRPSNSKNDINFISR